VAGKSAWIVVEVNSGIPVDVRIFTKQDLATEYLGGLRQNLNPDNDEVGIFEVDLPID
jgi:hypothetical protein